jgi:hypothetical protein
MREPHLKGYRFHERAWASYEELGGYGQTEAPAFATDCAATGVEHRLCKLGKPAPATKSGSSIPETFEPVGRD